MNATWREADGAAVEPEAARAEWTTAAHPILLAAASKYGSLVAHKDLAEAVQIGAGIRTNQRMDYWIGKVLAAVAARCETDQTPILSAFCVRADDTVGPSYANAIRDITGTKPEDPEQHAADERFKAHVFFTAELPADGGRPRLTPAVARRRARAAALEPVPSRPMCPNCFVEMPMNGPCGLCDDS